MMARIGFVGLGNMGGPMVRNLLKAQHGVGAFDLSPSALEAAVGAGAQGAASAAEAVRDVDAVVTMVPAGPHVRDVYLGAGGVLDAVRPGTLLIDLFDDRCRDRARGGRRRGIEGLRHGRRAGFRGNGRCGGRDVDLHGRRVGYGVRAGPSHIGAYGKDTGALRRARQRPGGELCNNMMLAINMLGVSEGFTLADNLGLDRDKLFEVAAHSSGQSWALTSYCPVPGPVPTSPANRDFAPGFTADMMVKDLRLAKDAAVASGTATPMGALAEALFALLVNKGHGASDFSAIIRMIRAEL